MNTNQMALEALKRARGCILGLLNSTSVRDADETLAEMAATITALEAEIAQGVEPAAWVINGVDFYLVQQLDFEDRPVPNQVPLYAALQEPLKSEEYEMTTPTEREAFEAWWESCHQCRCEDKYGAVRDGWDAWQASRKQALMDAIKSVDSSGGDNADYHIDAIKELLK